MTDAILDGDWDGAARIADSCGGHYANLSEENKERVGSGPDAYIEPPDPMAVGSYAAWCVYMAFHIGSRMNDDWDWE